MSGGRWGYLGPQLRHAAREIEAEILEGELSLAVKCKLAEAAACLRRAAVYEERCDWLMSCDDGPDTFLHSLAKDLREVEIQQLRAAVEAHRGRLRLEARPDDREL
jgi:hypothetical protein